MRPHQPRAVLRSVGRGPAFGLPRLMLRWAFCLALLLVSSSALWLTAERLDSLRDPRPLVLSGLQAGEERLASVQKGAGAANLLRWLAEAPELAPLVLRHALLSGTPPATVRAAVHSQLDEEHARRLAGWLELIELENSSSAADGATLGASNVAMSTSPYGPFSRRVRQLLAVSHHPESTRPAAQIPGTASPPSSPTTLFDRSGRPLLEVLPNEESALVAGVPHQVVPAVALDAARQLAPGAAARSTIDLELSRAISARLERAIARLSSRAGDGTVVVLGAHDAELLSAVVGSHSPTTLSSRHGLAGVHSGLTQQREPASIAKLITAAAAYRIGIDADEALAAMTCNAALRLGNEILYCPSRKGPLAGLEHAMASSCNVAFAELGRRMGPDALLEEYRRFGLATGPPTSEHLGFVPNGHLRSRALGDLAVGLNYVEITPLHAALLARSMVDGWQREPVILRARTARLGISQRPLPSDVRAADALAVSPAESPAWAPRARLVEPEVLAQLQRSMRAVVGRGGTAYRVAPAGMQVAMKTGTGRTQGEGFHVNYIGFTGDPSQPSAGDVAFSVRLVGGRSSRWVRREAKLLTAEILDLLQRRAAPLRANTQQVAGLRSTAVPGG